jgi:hypothetical protein
MAVEIIFKSLETSSELTIKVENNLILIEAQSMSNFNPPIELIFNKYDAVKLSKELRRQISMLEV